MDDEDIIVESVERDRFWLFDIFMYPASFPGLMFIGVYVGLAVLLEIFGGLLSLGLYVIDVLVLSHFFWYMAECVYDSAEGNLRAPETMFKTPDIQGMVIQMLEIFGCFLIFIGPVVVYLFISDDMDWIFWSLAGYAVFFLPMGLLACTMFGSLTALNPFLIVPSIFSTLLPYCGLVILLCGILGGISVVFSQFKANGVLGFCGFVVFLYIAMVFAHLLGRFYWRYQDKLYWEV